MTASNAPNYDIIAPMEPTDTLPVVLPVTLSDLADVIAKGIADFRAMPTHTIFLAMIYPIIGILLGSAAFGYEMVPLLFPIAAGFALVGPFAAIGLYELSRRREAGRDTSWHHAFDVLKSPSFGSLLKLGLLLLLVFITWVAVADWIHVAHFGKRHTSSLSVFIDDVLNTPQGHSLIVVGIAVGLVFALAVLSLTVVSFPLLLDRNVSLPVAMATSLKVVAKSPVTIALWGLIVAVSLAIGSIPFFLGLAIVVPVLGHATWHLYRKAIKPEPGLRPEYHPQPKRRRYAAEFPASLFVPSSDVDQR